MHTVLRLGIALVLCLALSLTFHGAIGVRGQAPVPVAGPAAHGFPPDSAQLFRLTSGGDALQALDPQSLADRPHDSRSTDLKPSSAQNTTAIPTSDGTRYLVVNQLHDHLTLQLFDERTGSPLSTSHRPAVPLGIIGLSSDGWLAYGFPISNSNAACKPITFYLLNTRTGHIVRHVQVGATFWTPVLVDPKLRYLYAMTSHDGIGTCGTRNPIHPVVSAYDLRTGIRVHSIMLNGVIAGHWLTQRVVNGSPVVADWTPGFALSPDGRQLAILDGPSNQLTLLAAPSLRTEGTESLLSPTSTAERIASALGFAPTVAEAKGQSQGMSLQIQYMPTGRSLLVTGTRFLPDNRHVVGHAESLGIGLIGVGGGRVEASLHIGGFVAVRPAPDGSGVYSETQGWKRGMGWLITVRRHDARSLRVLASRTFAHTSWLSLVFLRSR